MSEYLTSLAQVAKYRAFVVTILVTTSLRYDEIAA
jgi:hypothetical protein